MERSYLSYSYVCRHMTSSAYDLFGLDEAASPADVLRQCKNCLSQWTVASVRARLGTCMPMSEACVNTESVYKDGLAYLKSSAMVLLEPSARQCYDAWLDAVRTGNHEKITLTRARLLWFNKTESSVKFSEGMIKALKDTCAPVAETPAKPGRRDPNVEPQCRACRCPFSFTEEYLVLHCHCTTRVGHVQCMQDFASRVKHKCPVCRKALLKRHQVSKYLFWNVKDKYKFVS